jgi:hypothetical protein
VIHGAPNDTARITSTTAATTQDAFVSTDCTLIGLCIMDSWVGDVLRASRPRHCCRLGGSEENAPPLLVRGDDKRLPRSGRG